MITVLIVDDHEVVRQGLRFLLDQQPDIEVVGECADGDSAITAVQAMTPAVVLLDLLMPGIGGLAALDHIKRTSPATAVVVLTSHVGDEYVLDAVKAGAISYMLKTAGVAEVLHAVRAASRGESILDPGVAARVLQEVRTPSLPLTGALTTRETEVLILIARGHPNKEIANRLCIGEETVKTHVSNMLAKLHLADRTQAAIFAHRTGLVQ